MRRALYFWTVLFAVSNFPGFGFGLTAFSRETPSYIEVAEAEIVAQSGATNVSVNIVRSGEFRQSCSIGYRTVDGTAKAGKDYIATDDRLTFAAGRSFVSINVALIPADSPSEDKEFVVVLEEPSSNGLVVRGEVTIRLEGRAAPQLTIRRANSTQEDRAVVLAWPVTAQDGIVESCADPIRGEWRPVLEPVTVVDGEARMEIMKEQANAFFRLRVP